MSQGRHSIWEYLKAWKQEEGNLAIIGAPGSGKTTLLKHAALVLALKNPRRLADVPDKLPVLLFLRNHAAAIAENKNLTLAEAVRDSLEPYGLKPPDQWFENQLQSGRCLVMLDGLDEVADAELRKKVCRWVEARMAASGDNRFLVTSRPFGYGSNPLAGVNCLEVRPFTIDQVREFVHNWYLANEIMSSRTEDEGVRLAAKEGAENLLRALRAKPALSDLAVNPLLLTMIATVHRYRSSLPGRRVELYAEICEVFLGKRQEARGLELEMTPPQKQRVLEPLAYFMIQFKWREIGSDNAAGFIAATLEQVKPDTSGEDFLKMVENSSGLIVERKSGVCSFAHLTFQEYLAAVHIQRRGLSDELVGQVANSWWHETIRLYVAQSDATPVIEACLAHDPPPLEALVLAIECLDEAQQVAPALREHLDNVLSTGLDDPDPGRRRAVREPLLALRLRRLTRLDENRYIDDSLVTNAEYQLFLDERRYAGEYFQPDH